MDATELTDLIRRAQRREPAAFDALVDAYSPRLYGYFYRLTGSQADAEDLLQEVFVRLVRMIGRYEHNGRFEGWLFRIATNLVRDRVRRSRAGITLVQESDGPSPESGRPLASFPDHNGEDPGAAIVRSEEADRLQQAIGRLPEAEREVILLRHFSQMSFRDIADAMETPLGTALARAHRALGRLREMMGADG